MNSLSDLSMIHYGKSPSEVLTKDGSYPIVGTGGIYGHAKRAMFSSAIVVPRKGSLGNPQLIESPFWPVDTTYAVIPKDRVDIHWLYYCLLNFDLTKLNEATGVPSISREWLLKIKFYNPGEKNQKKIAKILKSIDQTIEKTEALIQKYQQIKQGLMHDLFTRGVTPDGKLRPTREQAPDLYKETSIGWIPEDWNLTSLKDLIGNSSIVNGPFGSDLLTSELFDEGIPVLYVQDVKPGYFLRISKAHVKPQKALSLSFCNVKAEDILVAKVGSPPCDSCVYRFDEKAIVTQDVIRIRPPHNVDSNFVSAFLNSYIGRKLIRKISIEGTRERVSLSEFKNILIPEINYKEQFDIGRIIQTNQNLIDNEMLFKNKLLNKKAGLMKDLLTGKVQVKTD